MSRAERPSFVVSLGGSVLFHGLEPDMDYLPRFAGVINKLIQDQNAQYFITVGGGKPARLIQSEYAAKGIHDSDFLDRLGIHVTHDNAQILVRILQDNGVNAAYVPKLSTEGTNASVHVTGGTEPKQSTDAVAVEWAHLLTLSSVYNITNVPYVYKYGHDGLPNILKPIRRISGRRYINMVGQTHRYGEQLPAGRIGILLAERYKIDFFVMGPDLPNIANALRGLHFRGTLIHP